MKHNFIKSVLVLALGLISMSAMAVDWSSIAFLGDGAQGGALSNKYKVEHTTGIDQIVNIQHPGFASEDGIYMSFVDAAFGEIRIGGVQASYDVQGAGICLHVSNFRFIETEVQVMNTSNTDVRWTFNVYYADGDPLKYLWCHTTTALLHRNFGDAYLTWATAPNGNVVITIDGATFRNGGFENNGTWANSWKVLSGANNATIEDATEYFTGGTLAPNNLTYTLTKKVDVDLPEGAVIQFIGHAFSWKIDEHNEYYLNPDMKYSYGENCDFLDAPTNVVVTNAGVITFDEVDDADAYIANIYSGSTLLSSVEVTSGSPLDYQSYVATTLTVKVVATGLGKSDSPESDGATWNVSASPLPESVFCGAFATRVTANNGSCSPLFTINTLSSGDVTIVLSASEGTDGATKFRNTGMNGAFKLNGDNALFNTYFDKAKTDDYTYTLTLKDADNKPELGAIISYSGQIEAESSVHGNDWSNYDLEGYLYGTKCEVRDIPVTGITLNQTTSDLYMGETITLVPSIEPVNATDKSVIWASSDENKATVANGVVTPIAIGTVTITATTVDGNFEANCVVTIKPAVAAPAVPTMDASDVIAVYSDTYEADCDFGEWGSGTQYTQTAVGKKYITNSNGYFGLTFEGPNAKDCSTMDKLHLEIFPLEDMTVRVVPIWGGTEQGITSPALVAGEWNSIDLTLSDYNVITDWTNIYQIKIDQASNKTFYINNVYFYKETAYTRATTAGDFGTICLPKGGTIEGATLFDIDYKTTNAVAISEHAGAMEAGVAYIFQATADKLTVTYAGEAVATPAAGNALVGTFEAIASVPQHMYILSNNQLCEIDGGTGTLAPYRAYLNMSLVSDEPTGAPVRMIELANPVATALVNATAAKATKALVNGQLVIVRNGAMFNINGMLVK